MAIADPMEIITNKIVNEILNFFLIQTLNFFHNVRLSLF